MKQFGTIVVHLDTENSGSGCVGCRLRMCNIMCGAPDKQTKDTDNNV